MLGATPEPGAAAAGSASLARTLLCGAGMANDMVKLGVLWKKTTREGNRPFLSGSMRQEGLEESLRLLRAGGRFLVLANQHKREGKNDPDCELFVVPARTAPGQGT